MADSNNSEILNVLQQAAFGLAIIELSGDFRFVNEGFAKLHGLTTADFIGLNFRQMNHQRLIERVSFFETLHAEFVRGVRDTFKGDVEFKDSQGSKWFYIESTLLRNGSGCLESIVVIAYDVTLRKAAEQRALQMANRLEAIHHSEAIGMHYFTRGGVIKEPNEALLAMAGFSGGEANNLTLDELTPAGWREQDQIMFRQLYQTRRPVSFLKEISSRKTGNTIPVSVTATLFENDSEYDGVSLICDLSDLFNAREEAEESRRKADLALSASSIGLWDLCADSSQVNFDERSRSIFGIDLKSKIDFESLSLKIVADDIAKIRKSLRQLTSSDSTISLTVEFRLRAGKNGERIVCATGRTFRVRPSGELRVVGTVTDVTETKLFEQRIVESEERFRTLAETIPQIVFTADQNGHVNYINKKWYDFTGQRPAEMVTREQIREAIHPMDLPLVRDKWHRARLEGRAFEIEYRMRSATGTYRWVIVRASPLLDRSGQTTRWFGSCTDIDSHRRLNDELWIDRDLAQKANKMKSSFLANMSHEIRTPLGAILGFTELLGGSALSEADRAEYLGIIARNSRSLSRIVDDVLDLSKVEAGLLTTEKVAFCPRTLLKDIVTLFSESARRKQLRIDLKTNDDVPASVVSDPMRLRQIINNLLSNALKFTSVGSISIELSRIGQLICIAVDDTGPGIGKEHLETLFQPFIQGDETMSRKHGGTGLGLHLSRKLAEALGGSLRFAEKGLEPGSRFVLTLPLIEASIAEADQWHRDVNQASQQASQPIGERQDLDAIQILVVDDAPDNRKLIERMLRPSGVHVDFAVNGATGVEKALSSHFDLILMDLQMPDVDGFEAAKQIRNHQITTPIVALTAHAVEEIRERCECAGFNGFLTKPIDSNTLKKLVKDLSNQSDNVRANASHN
jgi:PAS domain S-box-containing protein